MRLPDFTAEASLAEARERYLVRRPNAEAVPSGRRIITPQFAFGSDIPNCPDGMVCHTQCRFGSCRLRCFCI